VNGDTWRQGQPWSGSPQKIQIILQIVFRIVFS